MKFLLVRLGALGDIVHAIPVAVALRRAYPDAQIDWIVSAKHREILDLVPVLEPAYRRERSRRCRRRAVAARGDWRAAPDAVRRGDRHAGAAQVRRDRAVVRSAARDWLQRRGTRASRWRVCSTRTCTTRAAKGLYAPSETRHVVTINLGLLTPLGIAAAPPEFLIDAPCSAAVRRHHRPCGPAVRAAEPRGGVAEQAVARRAPGRARSAAFTTGTR